MVEDLEACVICCAPKLSENNAYANEIAKCLSFKWRMNSGGRTECYNSSSIDKNHTIIFFLKEAAEVHGQEKKLTLTRQTYVQL